VEASIAEPAANVSELAQASPRNAIIRPAAAVTERAPMDPERGSPQCITVVDLRIAIQ
jgi:hypothetical protein